jgi:branched-chain amino acid transport system ATP-binding protein
MSRPKLIIFDEPSLGLAPKFIDKIFQIIERINRDGVTVLLVEQNARQALQIAGRGYVLERGKITLSDTAANLSNNEFVKKAYLGY